MDPIKDKKPIYLSKSDKNKDEIEKDKNIYIIEDENKPNEEDIIYIESIFDDITKNKKYNQAPYIKAKDKPKKIGEDNITYYTK